MKTQKRRALIGDIVGIICFVIVFLVPFYFMVVNSLKDRKEANLLSISFPTNVAWSNFAQAFTANHYQVLTAFRNSAILTGCAVVGLIFFASMAGYVLQRRRSKAVRAINIFILIGLMVPAAIMPTIWVLQFLHIYKSMFSMIMIEIALQTPFTIMLYRGFVGGVPVELEEAACIDGCSTWGLFTKIVFPLLRPVTATVIVLNACTVFNDFTNPLYFLPGANQQTVQQTLYTFMGQYSSSYNLLFADVIIITIPMLIVFIIFNRQLVEGMTAGAVKG